MNDAFLPQSGWKLLSADSQKTQGENHAAINAFDGQPWASVAELDLVGVAP